MPDVHALLSASGAARWLSCTPSARLEEKFQNESSEYAREGTVDRGLEFRLHLRWTDCLWMVPEQEGPEVVGLRALVFTL